MAKTSKEYREAYEAKLMEEGFVCENHPDKPATTTKKTLCYACYSKQRWANDPAYKEAQNARHKRYVSENRERINAISKKWRDNNPEKFRAAVKASIAKRNAREEGNNND